MRALLIALIAAGAAAAEGDVAVDVASPWYDDAGYTPVVVTIRSARATRVELTVDGEGAHASLAVDVPAGAIRRTLLVPPPGGGYGGQRLDWRAPAEGLAGTAAFGFASSHHRLDLAVIDRDERIGLTSITDALASLQVSDHRAYSSTHPYDPSRVLRLQLAQLPDRWQGYPGWLVLLIAPRDDAELSDEQRQAIADWARTGGSLWVQDAAQVARWRELGVEPRRADLGDGLAGLRKEIEVRLADDDRPHPRTTVPGTEHVPVSRFLLVALLFALVVGPLNLWWVRRRRERTLFLVTTPALSLATCVSLVVCDLVAEGVSLRRVAQQITLIDAERQRAVAWNRCTYFAGFSAGTLDLPAETMVLPEQEEEQERWSSRHRAAASGTLALAWGDRLAASGDWIPARVNRTLRYVTPRAERRRLIVRRDGARWLVTNGLGVAIDHLAWVDGDGHRWSSAGIVDGAEVALTSDPEASTKIDAVEELDARAARASAPGDKHWWFVARLAAPLDPPPGPRGSDVLPITSVACGRLAPADVKPVSGF